jgi:hypothetical protein
MLSKRGPISILAGKCGHGQIEEWKMEDVHKLHSLKKCCPKDDFPLSRIDKVVDSTAGCKMMALLDCFSDYQLVWL